MLFGWEWEALIPQCILESQLTGPSTHLKKDEWEVQERESMESVLLAYLDDDTIFTYKTQEIFLELVFEKMWNLMLSNAVLKINNAFNLKENKHVLNSVE